MLVRFSLLVQWFGLIGVSCIPVSTGCILGRVSLILIYYLASLAYPASNKDRFKSNTGISTSWGNHLTFYFTSPCNRQFSTIPDPESALNNPSFPWLPSRLAPTKSIIDLIISLLYHNIIGDRMKLPLKLDLEQEKCYLAWPLLSQLHSLVHSRSTLFLHFPFSRGNNDFFSSNN